MSDFWVTFLRGGGGGLKFQKKWVTSFIYHPLSKSVNSSEGDDISSSLSAVTLLKFFLACSIVPYNAFNSYLVYSRLDVMGLWWNLERFNMYEWGSVDNKAFKSFIISFLNAWKMRWIFHELLITVIYNIESSNWLFLKNLFKIISPKIPKTLRIT